MGFGTLFIGYFLILNLTYFGYTDTIAALIMMLGLYRLSSVNRDFKFSMVFSIAYALIGTVELFEAVYSMFNPSFNTDVLVSYVAPFRYLAIGFLTAFMLLGIKSVAEEVGLYNLSRRARIQLPFCYTLFALMAITEFPALGSILPTKILSIAAIFLLLFVFVLIITVLVTVYTAYMRICMPEDINKYDTEKQSKLEFVNKFRAHEAQKQKEYAEYKLNKLQKKRNGKKK